MTPEDWMDRPWTKIVMEDSLSERLDPLEECCFLLEELFRELSACEEIVCGSDWDPGGGSASSF